MILVAVASTRCYTPSMKTAISIPDAVFTAADRLAKRTNKSRSQLYAEAVVEYLSRHAPDEVTEAMNRALAEIPDPVDPIVLHAARKMLGQEPW